MSHVKIAQRISHENDIVAMGQILEIGGMANGSFVFVEHVDQLAGESHQLLMLVKLHVVGYDFHIVFHQAGDFQRFVYDIAHAG